MHYLSLPIHIDNATIKLLPKSLVQGVNANSLSFSSPFHILPLISNDKLVSFTEIQKLQRERDAMQKQVQLINGQLNLVEGSKRRTEEAQQRMQEELKKVQAELKASQNE